MQENIKQSKITQKKKKNEKYIQERSESTNISRDSLVVSPQTQDQSNKVLTKEARLIFWALHILKSIIIVLLLIKQHQTQRSQIPNVKCSPTNSSIRKLDLSPFFVQPKK